MEIKVTDRDIFQRKRIYTENEICWYNGVIYKSLQNKNENNIPGSTPLFWEVYPTPPEEFTLTFGSEDEIPCMLATDDYGYYSTFTYNGVRLNLEDTDENNNVIIGKEAVNSYTDLYQSVVVGHQAGYKSDDNTGSVFLGFQTGHECVSGNKNVFVGYQAGYAETGSNKLYIAHSNTSTPLIYGEFDNSLLKINGGLEVTSRIKQTQLTGSLTDGAPTPTEINTITSLTPSTAGAGYQITILDSDGTGLLYRVESDGTDWFYTVMTKSV